MLNTRAMCPIVICSMPIDNKNSGSLIAQDSQWFEYFFHRIQDVEDFLENVCLQEKKNGHSNRNH